MALFLAFCIVAGGALWLFSKPAKSRQLHYPRPESFPVVSYWLIGGRPQKMIVYFSRSEVEPLLAACQGDRGRAHRLLSKAINAEPGKGRRIYLQRALEQATGDDQL